MASLSFDVLRWLNTLELKKVPRNLRHDISSGHVVAEIISRYFRDSCSILDLSEGNLPADRKENWLYIERCLRGVHFPFPEDWDVRVDAVCTGSGNIQAGACAILTYLYEFTTKKLARHPTRCDKPETTRPATRGSGHTTTRIGRDIPIVIKTPAVANPVVTSKERDKLYNAQFVTRVVTFAEIAQATLTLLQKSFLDMDNRAYIAMIEQNFNLQELSGVAYEIRDYASNNIYMRKKYIQVAEEASFMLDISLDDIINDPELANESIRSVFHLEFLRLLEHKVDVITEAVSFSLESELFTIFAFCSTYSLTLSTVIFSALQRFLTSLLMSIIHRLSEENLQSTKYLDFIVHSLFSYLPTSFFATEPVSYQNIYDPVTLAMSTSDIYGKDSETSSQRNFFSLGLSPGYISSPISSHSLVYPAPSYNTAKQIGPIEFVAHCMAIIISIFPHSGVIMLNNYLFSSSDYSVFELPSYSSKDYLSTQLEGVTEEYNLVKAHPATGQPISFLTQHKLAFLLATLRSLGKLPISSSSLSFEDFIKLLEYFAFFANKTFMCTTNNTKPNSFAVTRTCATTRDCIGLCTQIWSETCVLLASYLNHYSDLKTSTFETLIIDCDEGSRSILSVLVRSVQNMQRMLTGLSTKQIKKLSGKVSAASSSARGSVLSSKRSASGRLLSNDMGIQRSAGAASSLSIFRATNAAPPHRDSKLAPLATHISLGLRRIISNFVRHESIFVIRSFVRSLATTLTETYKVISVLVDMCIQIYISRADSEPTTAIARPSITTAKPVINRSMPIGTPRKGYPVSTLSIRDTSASIVDVAAVRSMNGIYTGILNINTIEDLLKVLEKGTTEHVVLNGIHNLIVDTEQIMSECANMVLLIEEEILSVRNADLFGNVLDFDLNDIDEFPVLEAHRRIFDAFIDQAGSVGCATLRSIVGDDLAMPHGCKDRYSCITPGGNLVCETPSNVSRTSSAHRSNPASAHSRGISERAAIRRLRAKDSPMEPEESPTSTSSILTEEVKDGNNSP